MFRKARLSNMSACVPMLFIIVLHRKSDTQKKIHTAQILQKLKKYIIIKALFKSNMEEICSTATINSTVHNIIYHVNSGIGCATMFRLHWAGFPASTSKLGWSFWACIFTWQLFLSKIKIHVNNMILMLIMISFKS